MFYVRLLALTTLAVLLGGASLAAQAQFGYRGYALESSVVTVLGLTDTRADTATTLHERPARIQEVVWRAPYSRVGGVPVDPVHDVVFSFYDDRLYRIAVNYERDRTEGLTTEDVIGALSATYGAPLLRGAPSAWALHPADAPATPILAQWEDAASAITLTRSTYSPQYRLVLVSKALEPKARAAIAEALRLDAQEAPQREADRRVREVADTAAADEKARAVNKAAFRP